MDLSKRVIYSPIRRTATTPDMGAAPDLAGRAALKYVDDDQSDGEQVEYAANNPASARDRHWNTRESSSTRRDRPQVHEGQAEEDDDDDDDDEQDEHNEHQEAEDERASVEEVYLCSCCGTTSELEPAMKYLPVFRSLFVLFNCLALVFGLASLGLGLWFRLDPKVYELHRYIETQNFTIAGWLMLAGGAATCLLALLVGCAASARHSICLLLCYALALGLLALGSIGTLVLLTVYGLGDSLERSLTKEVYDQIRRRAMGADLLPLEDPLGPFGPGGSSGAAQFIDFVQVKLRCCGALDFRDYQKLGQVIPTTCYTIAANFINAPGCGQALRELFDLRAGLAAGCTAAAALAQLLASVFAGLMVCSIYNQRATPRPASALSSVSRYRSQSRASNGPRPASPNEPLRPVHFQRVMRNYPPPSPLSGAPSIEV